MEVVSGTDTGAPQHGFLFLCVRVCLGGGGGTDTGAPSSIDDCSSSQLI